jgi:N-methylhydantoinase A/oxoprolinase/acetone carboxylase beta subunit
MQPRVDLRLGIDVGGTNTDAVILGSSDSLVAKAKAPTTPDVDRGIRAAIDGVLASADVSPDRITHVMIGTTHSSNAVIERRGLRRVGVVRIGAPATEVVPPLATWPHDLRDAVSGGVVIIGGGVEFDGRLLAPFDREALIRFLDERGEAIDALAVVSVFAPVSDLHERLAEEVVRERLGHIPLSLSHEIGALGILERENATVLNSALFGVAANITHALEAVLAARGINAATYFAQNDGTLMALEYVLKRPVLTIGSGSANSMRGAAFLSGLSDTLVADIGGTSTDIGILVNGFPRESAIPLDIGNVSTNFRMPDLVTIAVGGGTIVMVDDAGVRLGPISVRHRVLEMGLAFGGSTPTLTDAAVNVGRLDLGNRERTFPRADVLRTALHQAEVRFAEAIDRIKSDRKPHPLVVVGGAATLMPNALAGVSEVVRPRHHDVANAIGAAIAPVGGQVDRVVHRAISDRTEAVAEAKAAARNEAIKAGADPDHIETVEVEEVPMTYLPDPAVRLRVRAVGPLGMF